ncbi:MAG: hypothetical protein M5T61_06340 [Acidimicrobiia bacterium]|nr:hypothetical protein [Acidimicrobiia bacterium]
MSDWTTEAADQIERAVTTVRERTVVPARSATRAVIFGLLAAFFALPALLLLTLGVFRLADAYLPGEVWSAWLVLAGIFLAGGAFIWSKRNA